jgi:hypothetical protein
MAAVHSATHRNGKARRDQDAAPGRRAS